MEEERTEFCSNCKRDIRSVNYVMHAAHCKRNIVLCKECQEPVAISQQEEHFKEYHTKVKCECGEQMERMYLEDHKESDCPSRKVACSICELELPFSEMNNHQEYCGSRTENCEKCNRYIKLKDMDLHLSSDCKLPEVPKPQITYPEEGDHQLSDEISPELLNSFRIVGSENLGYRDLQALLTGGQNEWVSFRPHWFNESPDMKNKVLDEDKQMPRDFVVPRGVGMFPSSKTISSEKEKSIVKQIKPIPIYNNNVYAENEEISNQQNDDDHHLLAAYLADTFDEKTDGMSEQFSERAGPLNSPSGTFAEGFNTLEETCLPCEFCNNMYPASELILHQTGCQPSALPRHYLEQRRAPRSLPPLKNEPEARRPKSNSRAELFSGLAGSSKEEEYTDEEPFLPCEFCNVLLPISSIVHHQVHCEMGPQSRPPSAARGFNASKSIINPLPLLNCPPQFGNLPSDQTDEKADSETPDEEPPLKSSQSNSEVRKQTMYRSNSSPFAQFGSHQNHSMSGINSSTNDDDLISPSPARDNRRNNYRGNQILLSKNQRQYQKVFTAEERPKAKPEESDETHFRSVLKANRRPREAINNQAASKDRGRRDERRTPSQNEEDKPNSSDGFRRPAHPIHKKSDIHVGATVNWSPVFQDRKPASNKRHVVSDGTRPRNPTEKKESGDVPTRTMNCSPVFQDRKPASNVRHVVSDGTRPRNPTEKKESVEVPTRRKQKPTTNAVSQQRASTRPPRETTRGQGGAPVAVKKSSTSRKKIV